MNYLSSITIDNVMDALTAFLTPFVPGQIVRAQVNQVALPPSPCVVLTELLEVDLNKPHSDGCIGDGTAIIYAHSRIDVQIDFYGPSAGEYCKAVKSAFRTDWGVSQFPANIVPLYTDDGRQMPLITGEEQYEWRWTLTASMQYNPTVTVPQQSADVLKTDEVAAV